MSGAKGLPMYGGMPLGGTRQNQEGAIVPAEQAKNKRGRKKKVEPSPNDEITHADKIEYRRNFRPSTNIFDHTAKNIPTPFTLGLH